MRSWRTMAAVLLLMAGVFTFVGLVLQSLKPSVSDLVQQLRSPKAHVRENAAKALGAQGPAVAGEALPGLLHAIGDVSPDVRRAAEQAIGKMGDEARSLVPELVRLFHPNADPAAREVAVNLLVLLRATETVPALEQAFLTEPRGGVMGHAFAALWLFDPEHAIEVLRRVGPENLRAARAAALPTLVNALKEKSEPEHQRIAAETLTALGADARAAKPELVAEMAVPRLVFLWRYGKPGVRKAVAEALKSIDPQEAACAGVP